MHNDASALSLLGRGHVNLLTSCLQHPPQNSGTEMAERGSLPAGEHSRHETTVTRERQVTYGIHALMHAMENLPPHPPIDFRPTQPKRHELSASHDPMLPPPQLREHLIGPVRPEFFTHALKKSGRTPFRPGGVARWRA
jgi:hypothetical protein